MNSSFLCTLACLFIVVGFVIDKTYSQTAQQSAATSTGGRLKNDVGMATIAKRTSDENLRAAISQCLNGNAKEALPSIEQLSKSGNKDATFVLASLYLSGTASTPDAGRKLLLENGDKGHGFSLLTLGQIAGDENPAQAMVYFQQAETAGEPLAHLMLGNIAENGSLGTRTNLKRAIMHYRKLAESGDATGNFQFARCTDKGIGISPNPVEATRLYRKAAISGMAAANVEMARRYLKGQGTEQDPVAAIGWLIRGAQSGSTEAMVLLGQQYETGKFIGKDLNVAGQMYSSAAKLNDPQGKYHLALLYLNGIGTKADPVRAYVLLSGALQLTDAKKVFDQLSSQLTPEQITFAKKKIAESN